MIGLAHKVCTEADGHRRTRNPRGYLRGLPEGPGQPDGRDNQRPLDTHPRAAPRHAWFSSSLAGKLTEPVNFGTGGRGARPRSQDVPELQHGADVLVADLAGRRRKRLPDLPDTPWLEVAPYWVCEILSPSTVETCDWRRLVFHSRALCCTSSSARRRVDPPHPVSRSTILDPMIGWPWQRRPKPTVVRHKFLVQLP